MISVIIPNYNAGKYIIEAVESVLVQNMSLELLIVDDNSKDASLEMLLDWLVKQGVRWDNAVPDSSSNNRENKSTKLLISGEITVGDSLNSYNVSIKIYKNNTNMGVCYCRNFAVESCQGDYVAFLDADDYWDNDKLSKQYKLLKKTGAVLCNTARELIEPSGESTGRVIDTPAKITLKKLKHTNYINCSSVLIRREVIKKYKMEHNDAQEDYLSWLRILMEYDYVVGINEPLMKYRLTPKGKSRNKIKAAIMTYKTYCYAGFGIIGSLGMMFAYTFNGIRKYTKKTK